MRRVALLCWEIGSGLGHALPLLSIARALEARGWRAVLALPRKRSLSHLETHGVTVCAAPRWGQGVPADFEKTKSSATLGDSLAQSGLLSANWVRNQIAAWRDIFAIYSPDLIVADFAPGAVLAARDQVPCLAVGIGFSVPPPGLSRFPLLHDLAPPAHDERAVLATVNAVLGEFDARPLPSLTDALTGDAQCVRTLPILDPYDAMRSEPAMGVLLDAPIVPRRQDADQVFCYLQDTQNPDRLLEIVACLEELPVPVVAYLPGLPEARKDQLRSGGVDVLDAPAPLADQLARSRLVISHGGNGVTAAALMAGVPQVILPTDIEKVLNAHGIVERGAGRELPYRTIDPDSARSEIKGALDDSALELAASALASEHEPYRARDVLPDIVEVCEKMVSPKKRPVTEEKPKPLKLTAYLIDGREVTLRPAPLERDWMDTTPQRFAYRCLPLNVANAYGWEILCPTGFKATWNGEQAIDAITIETEDGARAPARSHFGAGVLTFYVSCLFRTEPGYDLMVQGPVNRPKDAIAPLQGIVETDWAPYTFTMNWKFTQPEIEIEFEAGEPFCHIFPLRRGEIESFQPEFVPLSSDPDLQGEYREWSVSRRTFNRDLKESGSEAQAQGWQKHYYRARDPDGRPVGPANHRTRLRLPGFERSKS